MVYLFWTGQSEYKDRFLKYVLYPVICHKHMNTKFVFPLSSWSLAFTSVLRSITHNWRRCRWPSGSWRRTCQRPDAAVICMKRSLETHGKRVRISKGKRWNTSRESKRYDHASYTWFWLNVTVSGTTKLTKAVFPTCHSYIHDLSLLKSDL